MTDLHKTFLLILITVLLTFCLSGCISVAPPSNGIESTAQTETEHETLPDEQTTELATTQTTNIETETATEEVTTFGELHFPESGE